ncbi:tail fiber protein [Halosquirtibacter xylanolyticus]|uniref:beta strand repeat-containing protein n=1 Tax=Halosquirtibacter xylanolyticus TaxID=3374599 RepID=UPI0037482E11|nr:tail fiber protein [Prolixibacteraceae bacterium]
MKRIYILFFFLLQFPLLFGQSVGIGGSDFTPDPSAALEIQSNNKGLLIPRMLEGERSVIISPSTGLLVYQTNGQAGFYYFNGSAWELLGTNVNDKDFDPTNEIQVLSISDDIITLSNGGGYVELPSGTLGAQTLTLDGTTLTISSGNSVDLSPLKDNLGNHEATKNIVLFSHYISGDGDDEGISISSNGDVLFSNIVTILGDIVLPDGSIDRSEIANHAVDNSKLSDGSVSESNLQDNTVGNSKIVDLSVTTSKIANSAVDNSKLADGSVGITKLLDNSVSESKILDGAVSSSKLSIGSVTTSKLAEGSVTETKLSDASISTQKLMNLSVSHDKLGESSVATSNLRDNSVNSLKLLDGSVTEPKLADGSVSQSKIQNLSVQTGHLSDNVVTEVKISIGSVTEDKLKDGAVTSLKLSDGSVTTQKIGFQQVTSDRLSSMNASMDEYLKWDGSVWVPSSIGGVLNYSGTWSASSNIPSIVDGSGSKGDFYIASTVGTQDFGSGSISFSPGDWVLYDGLKWERVNNSSEVNSVFGRKGEVTPQVGDYTWAQIDKTTSFLSDLSDVSSSNPDAGYILLGDGTHWTSSSVHGDVVMDSNGKTTIMAKHITYNKLQDASGVDGTILLWNGSSWQETDIESLLRDDLQDLQLSSSNILGLTKSGVAVDLSKYYDNTDDQVLSFDGNVLGIEGGNSVDLTPIKDNLGNHVATEQISLGTHKIGFASDNKGLGFDSNGSATFTGFVTAPKLIASDVTFGNGTINTAEIEDEGITSSKLSSASVTSDKLASNAVTTTKIVDGSVVSSKLFDGSVTSSKIGDGQITSVKLSSMNANTDDYLKWDGSVWVPSGFGGVLNYQGTWSAQSNVPSVSDANGSEGDFYVVSTEGAQDFGSGPQDFSAGDWILYDGSKWDRVNNSNEVNTVFGRKGVITAQLGDYTWSQIDKTTSFLSDLSEVLISTPNAGHVLLGNGSQWVSSPLQGDVLIDENGNTTIDNQRITYNKLQGASGTTGTILMWSGVSWEEVNLSTLVADEIQDPTLSSANLLGLTKTSVTVDLSRYLDNTDSQDLSLTDNSLSLTNDITSVDLSKYLDDTDNQNLELNGTVLSIEDGNSIDFFNLAQSVVQDLSITGNVLSLTQDDSTVDLGKYLDNTDAQTLSLNSSNELKISNTSSLVDLSKYLDNTDNQDLALTGNILSISGGTNTVDLSTIVTGDNQDLTLSGDELSLTNDPSPISLSPYRQSLSLNGSVVEISEGTGVDISSLLDLSLSGNSLGISGSSTTVDLSPLRDNLGDHQATEKLKLGSNKIGYGVEDKGLSFDSNGNAVFTGVVTVPELVATDVNLGTGTVGTSELANGSVTPEKINTLLSGELIIGTSSGNATVSIGGDATLNSNGDLTIKDNVITSQKISDGSVVSSDIADLSIQTIDISDGAISEGKLKDGSVTSGKLMNGAVTTLKLADGSVDGTKLSSMSANTDEVLQWNGSRWDPAPITGTLDYQGVWDPSTNTPTLSSGDTGISGKYYVSSQNGTVNLGSGNVDFNSGDVVLGTTSGWRKISNTNNVISVFGRTGVITAESGDYTWNQIDKSVSNLDDISDVSSSDRTGGNILISNGSSWVSKSLSGAVSVTSSGVVSLSSGSVLNSHLGSGSVDADKVLDHSLTYTKLQNATGVSRTVLVWNGSRWEEEFIENIEGDADPQNELQNLNLTGNDLSLSLNGSTINLGKYLDNTDQQSLSLVGTQLSISNGNNVDLSGFASTDSQELGLTGNTLTLTRSATSADLSKYAQTLTFSSSTNSLNISNGNSVDLSVYLDNTDNQDLSLVGNTLSLTSDATTVDLSGYLDNTDEQRLSISGHDLSITGGNTIDLSSSDSQDLSLSTDVLSLSNDATPVDLSPYRQSLSLTSSSLAISGGNSIDISSINTDAQTLSFSGSSLSILNGNSVDLSGLKDNLGSHEATQNIDLGSHWLSHDGTDKGLSIGTLGDITINKKLTVDELLTANSDVSVSGDLSVGTGSSESSAVLNISSSSKGILIPRMTGTQRDVIAGPATGLMIYNTSTNMYNFYNGVSWQEIGGDDNLGDHTATQNIALNGNVLSNDGDSEGLSVDNSGHVTFSGNTTHGGSVLLGSGSVDPSAIFEIKSTTKGALLPRMTTTEREAIGSPAKGLLVFDTTINSLFTYNGTKWVSAEASANTWNVAGNTTVDETTDFIGSVNAADVVIKSQNAEVVRVTKDSRVGIGTVGSSVETSAKLEVKSTNQGFLPPRMTTAQRTSIVNPAIGLVVFDTNKGNLFMYTGIWTEIGVPIGSIQPFMGTVIPDGWMLCDGSPFSATTYPQLQSVLGSTNLPDLRGVFLRGLDNGKGYDSGRAINTYQSDTNKSHTHSGSANSAGNHNHSGTTDSGGNHRHAMGNSYTQSGGGYPHEAGNTRNENTYTDYAGAHTHSFSTNYNGSHTHSLSINSSGGNEARPKNVSVNYIIRVK